MFDKLKAMGALAGLMKDQEKLRAAAGRIKEKSAAIRVTGQAGAGACKAVVTGQLKVVSVDLAPGLLAGMVGDERTRSLAATLIADAVNDGLAQAQVKLKEVMDTEARAMGLPEIPSLGGLLGGE